MKTKPILIAACILILSASVFLFVRSKNLAKPEKNEIAQFLTAFNSQLTKGNTDSLLSYFEINQKPEVLTRLLNILAGKVGVNGKSPALFRLGLDVEASSIKVFNTELAEANVPVQFTHDSIGMKQSVILFKIHKISAHQFKIIQIDANKFMTDYVGYDNLVRNKTISAKDIYDPVTLKSFETAKQLKARYDSVIWFAHAEKGTFFYVVKGKWDNYKSLYRPTDTVIEPYKMGLVGPDLKEVIPPDYDLIHNISGTFPGLIEVEKADKKGFYDLDGKIIVPVNYDQIFPIEDETNLAVWSRNGDDYFYFKEGYEHIRKN